MPFQDSKPVLFDRLHPCLTYCTIFMTDMFLARLAFNKLT